jgi:hypothetical protein
MKFKKGDIVKVKMNCTIEELNANNSMGCRSDTFSFIERDHYREDDVPNYKVTNVDEDGCCYIEEYIVNPICLELVERKPFKEKVREELIKTMEEFLEDLKKESIDN